MMNDLIRRIEFRAFSYEEDPESVVDMQRCREILDGGWLDSAETCRMNHKMVVRTPGSSWVLAFGATIFAYADMVPVGDGTGCVTTWRLHPDFRTPIVARKLLEGLTKEARVRNYSGLVFLADGEEVLADLERIGLKRDRTYGWVQPADLPPGPAAESQPVSPTLDELVGETLLPFLGPPLPPRFVLIRSFMAASYGVFHHARPALYRLRVQDIGYLACYDGREWFVFRGARNELDRDAVRPILATLASLHPGRILLSKKAAEMVELAFQNDFTLWDLFHPI